MTREVALDLVEKERLRASGKLLELELGTYKSLVAGLEENAARKDLQLELLERERDLLEARLSAEKARKPKDKRFLWVLRLLGALGAGYLLGSLH